MFSPSQIVNKNNLWECCGNQLVYVKWIRCLVCVFGVYFFSSRDKIYIIILRNKWSLNHELNFFSEFERMNEHLHL